MQLAHILLLSPLLLASPPLAHAQQLIERPEQGFRLLAPQDWQIEEPAQAGVYQLQLAPPGEGSGPQFLVRVFLKSAVGDLDSVRAQVQTAVAAAPALYSDLSESEELVAGRKGPVFDLIAQVEQTPFRLRQGFQTEGERIYMLQRLAPLDVGDAASAALDGIWESFELMPVAPDERQLAREHLRQLASRCGSELAWAKDWKEAAARARAARCLVLVYAKMEVGFSRSDETMTGSFMDPDVVGLISERYVPLRIGRGTPVPFADPKLYGMSGTTFGNALMLVTPEGEVVGESVLYLQPFLLAGLKAHPDYPGPPAPQLTDLLDQARALIRRGDLPAATRLLEGRESVRACRLRAQVARCRHDGRSALEELAAAGRVDVDGRWEPELMLDEAWIQARLGHDADALKLTRMLLSRHGQHSCSREVGYLQAALCDRLGLAEEARELWRALTEGEQGDRWSWKAAAALTSTAQAMGVAQRLEWPEPDLTGEPLRPRFQALSPKEVERAQLEALTWVMEHQDVDGGWFSPTLTTHHEENQVDELAHGSNIICAQGLVRTVQGEDGRAAAERALNHVVSQQLAFAAADKPQSFMDYSAWTRPYLLWLVADSLVRDLGDGSRLRETAAILLEEIAGLQKRGGGWSYYVTGDIESGSPQSEVSISCTTAAATLALQRAAEAGLEVPEALLADALDCLEDMRNKNGTFAYMLHPDQVDAPRGSSIPGAAGRGPACTLALYQGGRVGLDALRESLQLFVAHCGELAAERGKALMHAGADAQGSHYLMYDYSTAAMAIAALPRGEWIKYRGPLLEVLLSSRTPDGSYLDNPLIGRSAGTGLALIAFAALGIEPETRGN